MNSKAQALVKIGYSKTDTLLDPEKWVYVTLKFRAGDHAAWSNYVKLLMTEMPKSHLSSFEAWISDTSECGLVMIIVHASMAEAYSSGALNHFKAISAPIFLTRDDAAGG